MYAPSKYRGDDIIVKQNQRSNCLGFRFGYTDNMVLYLSILNSYGEKISCIIAGT